MEFHAPHPNAAFEGYYSKFDLPSGAKIALILCQIKDAKTRPYMVSFTYVPPNSTKIYQKEIWAEHMHMVKPDPHDPAFTLDVPGVGYIKWKADSLAEYRLECPEFSFTADTSTRRPWSDTTSTPESHLVHLPLPLHWHVQSLGSKCSYSLKLHDYDLPSIDASGQAVVHEEKNWAASFPSAHMWLQARKGDRSFCCAGGQILGLEAFLIGYRSSKLNIDFRPPFAVRLAGIGPFMAYTCDWEDRSFHLSVQGLSQKLIVEASAPKGSFFPLSCPFPEGFRDNFLNQSFQSTMKVSIFERSWLGQWRLVDKEQFEQASLEFGGGYYPLAGTDDCFN